MAYNPLADLQVKDLLQFLKSKNNPLVRQNPLNTAFGKQENVEAKQPTFSATSTPQTTTTANLPDADGLIPMPTVGKTPSFAPTTDDKHAYDFPDLSIGLSRVSQNLPQVSREQIMATKAGTQDGGMKEVANPFLNSDISPEDSYIGEYEGDVSDLQEVANPFEMTPKSEEWEIGGKPISELHGGGPLGFATKSIQSAIVHAPTVFANLAAFANKYSPLRLIDKAQDKLLGTEVDKKNQKKFDIGMEVLKQAEPYLQKKMGIDTDAASTQVGQFITEIAPILMPGGQIKAVSEIEKLPAVVNFIKQSPKIRKYVVKPAVKGLVEGPIDAVQYSAANRGEAPTGEEVLTAGIFNTIAGFIPKLSLKSGVKVGKEGVETLPLTATDIMNDKKLTKIRNAVEPKYTSAVTEGTAGKGTRKGILRTRKVSPTKEGIEQVKVADEIGIKDAADMDVNYNTTVDAIEKEAKSLESKAAKSKVSYNRNNLKNVVLDVKPSEGLTTDGETMMKKVKDSLIRRLDDNENTTAGMLKAVKEWRRLIREEYPNFFDTNKRGPLQKDVSNLNRAANERIDTMLEGEAKDSFKKQAILYDIADVFKSKIEKPGTDIFDRNKRIKPTLQTAAAAGGLGLIGNTISNLTK